MAVSNVVEMPQPLGLFAGDLLDRGIEYANAFEHLSKEHPHLQFSSYFLLAHSVELILKSYLASANVDKKTIRFKFGHKLGAAFATCQNHGIPSIENLNLLVRQIDEMNSEHDFRYPMGYRLSMPRPADCIPILKAMIEGISPTVERARISATLHFHSKERDFHGKTVRWSD